MGELKAAEARADRATKVAGVRTVKPEDPVSHDIRQELELGRTRTALKVGAPRHSRRTSGMRGKLHR